MIRVREKALKFIASSNLELNREYELGIQLFQGLIRVDDESFRMTFHSSLLIRWDKRKWKIAVASLFSFYWHEQNVKTVTV